MSLNLFRRLDRYDRRIRQLERTEPPEGGGGGGGDHADSDHADAFSPLAHTHAVHADSDHDDRFSLLAHSHGPPGAHTHDWADVTGEPATFPPTPQLLDWLTDVATAGQASTNVLTFNGSAWVPAAIPAQAWTSITGKPSTFPPTPETLTLNELSDVTVLPSDGYVLTYLETDGKWHAASFEGGGTGVFHPYLGSPSLDFDAWSLQAETVNAERVNVASDVEPYVQIGQSGVHIEPSVRFRRWRADDARIRVTDTSDPGATLSGHVDVQAGGLSLNGTAVALAPGAWQSAAGLYGSGWGASGTAGDQAPRYRLVGDNVQLDGVAARTSGTNTTIFTLPSGYRPTALKRYHTPSGTPSAFTRVAIDTAGVIAQTAGTDFTRTALEGCTFPIT